MTSVLCPTFSNILTIPRVIGFSSQTVRYLMSIFVRCLTSQASSILKVDFLQDLDGNGEIGIEEVSSCTFCSQHQTNHHPQFKPLWDYVKVGYSSPTFSVSFNACLSNGVKCLNLSTTTKTAS